MKGKDPTTCPVCGEVHIILSNEEEGLKNIFAPMLQVSYPGQKEYVSPRCDDCMNKLLAKRAAKEAKLHGNG